VLPLLIPGGSFAGESGSIPAQERHVDFGTSVREGKLMKALTVALAISLFSTSGCSSEVDKCVAAWEDAYGDVPNDDVDRFCVNQSSFECGHELNKPKSTKAEAVAEQRIRCLRASQGQD